MLGELIPLAIRNLMRARARLVMTSGGVLVGTTAVVILIALTFGLQRSAEASIGQNNALTEIQVYPSWEARSDTTPKLDVAAVRSFWQIPGVVAVIPTLRMQGMSQIMVGDYSGWGDVIGIDPALLPYLGITVQQGELALRSGQILVGPRVGENFYDPTANTEEWTPVTVDLMAQPVEIQIQEMTGTNETREVEVQAAGLLQEGSSYDYAILMPITDVIRWNEWSTGQQFDAAKVVFDSVTVRVKDRNATNDVNDAIRDLGYSTWGMGDYLNQLNSFFRMMRLMLGGVGGVALLVAAFGVANTMTMAILERTKEIGLMKAIGATDQNVLTVFLIESGLVGFVGGVAGVGLSFLLRNMINKAVAKAPEPGSDSITNFLPFDTSQIAGQLIIIPTNLAVLAILLATLVGVSAGIYPALRAARMEPVIALKSE